MRPMRFPRRSLWFIFIILGIVFGLPILPLLVSFVLVESPLQRYYLLTYVESGETAKIPGATTPVNWLYKTAPGRQRALLTEPDAVFAQNGKLPVRLSQAALKDGWTGIEESPEQRVNSARVEQILQKNFYNGVGYRWVMAKPALVCLLGFSVLMVGVIAIRRRGRAQSRHEERHGRRTKGPELVTAAEWNSKLQPDGIRFQLRGESSLLGSFSKLIPKLDSQYLAIRRNLEPNHILIMGDSGSGKTSAMRQILRQVNERQETAIVYDPALEFTPEFYSAERGDVILNPLDRRCPYWDIADESNSDDGNTAMAAALFPDKDYEKEYFTDAPRRIFTFLMRRHPSPQQLVEWMSNPAEIERMVKGTPYAAFLDPGAPAQRGGVLSSFNMIAESLEQLPSREGSRTVFSSGGWNIERRQWVFLTSRPASRQKILPLHSAWLDMLILRTMEPSMKGTQIKTYPHFDAPLSKAEAEKLVSDPGLVSRHPFYPFLQWVQGWSKFAPKGVRPNEKRRKIRYAARRDSYIYSHYRQLLYPLYESELRHLVLEECILAYRHIPIPGRKSGKCNIHFASEAFQVIRRLGNCCAIALDIEEFFENLEHSHIKRTWSRLLGQSDPTSRYQLPLDHFAVFRAVTQYSWIEKDLAYKELGLIGEAQAADGQKRIKYLVGKKAFPTQICSPQVFRQKLADKVKSNCNPWGIPQGSPISDLLANLYMIDFDAKLSNAVRSIGGRYFRYSDDILIILPGPDARWDEMLQLVDSSLGSTAPRLRIKGKKTQVYSYRKLSDERDQIATNIGPTRGADGLEYLGFRYDGKRIFLRNSTFSGFRRKIAEISQRMAKNHVLFNPNSNMKELVDSFNYNVLFKKFGRVGDFDFPGSEYTKWTFWTYIQRSVRILGTASSPVLRQVNDYKSFARGRVKNAVTEAYSRMRRP